MFGDNGEASSSSSSSSKEDSSEVFRVYFKGLLSDERVNGPTSSNKTMKLAGIGVAICDSTDKMIFEMNKPLDLIEGDRMSKQSVEGEALIEALKAATALDLKRIVLYCDHHPLYQIVNGRWRPKQQKVIKFLDQVNLLRKSLTYCEPSLIASKDVKFAIKLAREAIKSQISKVVSSQEKLENCVICLDDKSADQFFSLQGCTHRYCYSCVKQHVEVKLLNGVLPTCPHEGCKSGLRVECCEKFLTPKLTEMMRQRLKEDSIPVTEKVYCPYPKCSTLMSRTELRRLPKLINEIGAVTCYNCHGNFCIKCRVPWHENMNCVEYKKRNPTQLVEESKLKNLAAKNLWRQCVKCKNMIELAAGCYHITCRCGYEFCYTCGAEWKNKKATCTCPLWDEENIMNNAGEEANEVDAFVYYEHFLPRGDVVVDHGDILRDVLGDEYGDFEHDSDFEDDDVVGDEHGDFEDDDVVGDEHGDFEDDDVVGDEDGDFEDDDVVGEEYGDLEHDDVDEYGDLEHDDVVGEEYGDLEHDDVVGEEYGDLEHDDVVGDEYGDLEHDDVVGVGDEHGDFEHDDVVGVGDEYGDFEHHDVLGEEYGDFEHHDALGEEYGDFMHNDVLEDEYDDFW